VLKRKVMTYRMIIYYLHNFVFKVAFWLNLSKNVARTGKGAIYVANHCSVIDLMVCFASLYPFAGFAKRVLFYIPALAGYMRNAGFIRVRRNDPVRLAEAYEEAREVLKKGDTFLIFAEGTRSEDGHLQKFRKGAFKLAIEADVPIVPVIIKNTFYYLPKHKFWVNPDKEHRFIHVETLPPVKYTGDPNVSDLVKIKKLKEIVWNQMNEKIEEFMGDKSS
ncbi:MAG: 1-acyl-sn-glycerol-3-phosphate acyltransferase, partial [Actinomycetia bacterium]|nr:1-acyl-sn-glycerol-3-phosphate acyltransferase [Actinomycetes bacterium]